MITSIPAGPARQHARVEQRAVEEEDHAARRPIAASISRQPVAPAGWTVLVGRGV
jgi:hypothetical protein